MQARALIPVADAAHLTGPGRLDGSRANGLFAFRKSTAHGPEDGFVAFVQKGLLFASFTPETGDQYDYAYGVAPKAP